MTQITLTGTMTCTKPEDTEIFARYLSEHLRLSREEDGCLRFDIEPTDDPMVWQVDELWASREAYEAHLARTRGSLWFIVARDIKRDFQLTGA